MKQQYIFIEPTYIDEDPVGGIVLLPYPLKNEYRDENYFLERTGATVRGMPIYKFRKSSDEGN